MTDSRELDHRSGYARQCRHQQVPSDKAGIQSLSSFSSRLGGSHQDSTPAVIPRVSAVKPGTTLHIRILDLETNLTTRIARPSNNRLLVLAFRPFSPCLNLLLKKSRPTKTVPASRKQSYSPRTQPITLHGWLSTTHPPLQAPRGEILWAGRKRAAQAARDREDSCFPSLHNLTFSATCLLRAEFWNKKR